MKIVVFEYIKKHITKISLPGLICAISIGVFGSSGDLIRIIDLEGPWRFSIGEREEWTKPGYNDSSWETVKVPSSWEDEGFYGYNGFASYRKKVTIPSNHKGKALYLVAGYIDDVDETYFNGRKIGTTGAFPPQFETAYNANRVYYIPEDYINFDGVNVITIIVYDIYQAGGIVSGDIGIYSDRFAIPLEINLQGTWNFSTGDDINRRNIVYDDSDWDKIFVPGKWEDQHYRDYDGFAWYRKTFVFSGNVTDTKFVLLLGKIDDIDEVYVNGVKVGSTGVISSDKRKMVISGIEWTALRGYYFSSELLKKNQKNTISVRVYDSGGSGGIYEGPVGIISQKNYIEFWKNNRNNKW
ncbi:MAG: beta galactosidase jelly roll domain-containing protein [Bacteroidales bacterium]|nr:beta galactosidase jelly roll domain-containing protein [Bacteroidales bacterium]